MPVVIKFSRSWSSSSYINGRNVGRRFQKVAARKGWDMVGKEDDREDDVNHDIVESIIPGNRFHYYGEWKLTPKRQPPVAGLEGRKSWRYSWICNNRNSFRVS